MMDRELLLTDEYREAVYYAELGSPTKGKQAVDDLIAKVLSSIRNRLTVLTDEEIAEIYFRLDTVIKQTPYNKKLWLDVVKKNNSIPLAIAQAQLAKTIRELND